MKKPLLFLALFSFSIISLMAQHDHAKQDAQKSDATAPMFKDNKMATAYGNYLSLKDALVASNIDASKEAATKLQTSLSSVKESKNAADEAAKISKAGNLADARKAFAGLSNEMALLVKGGQLSMGALYLEYCPMANDNAGAYWLSNEKEIKNPYFGKMMLKCGSVKETIQ